MNQSCFGSMVDINYDNLDILAVKPKKSRKIIVSKSLQKLSL